MVDEEQPQPTFPFALGPVIVYSYDRNGVCTMSEGPGLSHLGLEPGELVGRDLNEYYDHDDTALAPMRRALAGETFTLDMESLGRVLETFHQPLRDPVGAIVGGLGVVRDVTEQRALEAEAHQARRRVSLLADLSAALERDVIDPPSLVHTCVNVATDAVGASGALWLLDPETDRLVLRAWSPRPAEDVAASFENPRGPLGSEMVSIPRSAVEGLRRYERVDVPAATETGGIFGGDKMNQWVREIAAATGLRVPLRARGNLIGMLGLGRRQDQGTMTDTDVDLVLDIADRCAMALDNAMLLESRTVALEQSLTFKALVDAASERIGISDPDGNTLYANARIDARDTTWAGRSAWESIAAHAGTEVVQRIQDALAAGNRWSGDVFAEIEGVNRVSQLEVFNLSHPSTGKHLGTAWLAQDVTQLRNTTADLMQFKSLVEASPEFIGIADLRGRLLYLNPLGREMIGLPDDVDVTTTTIADYLTDDGFAAAQATEHPVVLAQGHWEGESTLRDHRGGPPIPVSIASFLIRDAESDLPIAVATVQRNLSERLAAESAVRDLADQRQRLLTRLVNAQDIERAQIAAEVHDDSVQSLAAVDLRLGLLQRRVSQLAPELLSVVEPVRFSVSQATDRLRTLLFDLSPPDLDHGLDYSLRQSAQAIFEHSRTTFTVTAEQDPDLPTSTMTVAYRIVREAMFNALKHADAQHVEVVLTAEDGGLGILVTDDGVGIAEGDTVPTLGHIGLSSMADRAQIAGGRFSIGRRSEGGTEVAVWLPGAAPRSSPDQGPDRA